VIHYKVYLDTKQQLLTTVSDLTLRTFTCNGITSGGININTLLEGLQTTLDTTARINSANTFTVSQTIVGDLKADNMLVKNTTPTLTIHLTSKLYVDAGLNGKQNTLLADNKNFTNSTISLTSDITQEDLHLKQNILSRNSHLNIYSLIVSSDTFSVGTIVPGQISYNSLLIGDVDIGTT
jgi:hypothetical protein